MGTSLKQLRRVDQSGYIWDIPADSKRDKHRTLSLVLCALLRIALVYREKHKWWGRCHVAA